MKKQIVSVSSMPSLGGSLESSVSGVTYVLRNSRDALKCFNGTADMDVAEYLGGCAAPMKCAGSVSGSIISTKSHFVPLGISEE